jgi:hypothetical protein
MRVGRWIGYLCVKLGPGEKQPRINPIKKKHNGQQWKEMDYDEPHLMPNEKRGPFNGHYNQLVH